MSFLFHFGAHKNLSKCYVKDILYRSTGMLISP